MRPPRHDGSERGKRAAAVPTYLAQEGHWTINNSGARCYALNRPPMEMNLAPYNMLLLSLARGGRLALRVMFWPGAFRPEAPVRLTLVIANGVPPLEVAAKARILTVAASGVTQDLAFDVSRIGLVFAQLENCAQQLPQQ